MQQIQIAYKNSPDFLNRLLELKNYYEDNSLNQMVFNITWSGDVKNKLDTAIDKIEEIFPEAIYYGNEASGNIAAGEFSAGINVTCTIFDDKKSKVELVWVEKGTKVPSLNALWKLCENKKHLKGIELLPSLSYAEYLKIDREIPPIDKNVLIFGGTASGYDLPCFSADVLASGHPRNSDAMVVLLWIGEDLHISQEHVLGWQGLGRLLTINKVNGKTIRELDNSLPSAIYEKYLGPQMGQSETYVFPLLVYEDDVEFLRTPYMFNEDGSMDMFVNLPADLQCRLSYGDKNTILENIHQSALKVSEFRAEIVRAYSCAARRLFWGDMEVGKETKILDQIAPVSGFYSSGEIIRFGEKLRICNQTLSIVAMREAAGKDVNAIEVKTQEADKSMVSRLAFFTRKVTQEQEDALSAAYAANQAKTTFLFNMSHDIRTPMNAIIGFTNIAERDLKNNPPQALEAIRKVRNSSDILLSIINDILDMSRIESGKATLKLENIDITSILDKVEPVMRSLAAPKDIAVNFKTVNLKNRFVSADVPFVQRVLINIISNAIKYTNPNGKVDISLEELPSDNPDVGVYKYVVADNGIGMSEEFQAHMFEEFSREENSTVSGIQGTGLGLALAKRLMNLMGGTISCTSKKGVGSTFTLVFPFEIIESKSNLSSEIDESVKYADFTDLKVLIVEDNPLNREIACDIMSENGLTADTAENGQIAVEKLKEVGPNHYDFILMDIQMPVMNGYEATKAIRAMYPDDRIIIIALSANAFAEDKQASREAGMDDHVAKPININELKKAMAKFL